MHYPEHERVKAIRDKSQAIHEFLIWLSDEKDIHLATWVGQLLCYPNTTQENLVAEFFEVDLKAFHKEKDQMIEEMRKAQVPHEI